MKSLKDIFDWTDPKLFTLDSIPRRCIVFVVIIIVNFLTGIESFGVLMSDDLLRGAFALDANRTSWIGAIYLLGIISVIPIFCTLSCRFTTKTSFSIGFSIFLIGTTFCGLTTNFYCLLVGRFVSGLGSGIVMIDSARILKRITDPSMHTHIFAFNSSVLGFGVALAMIVGGAIGQTLHWRMIFLLDSALCIVGFILIWITFKERMELTPRIKIDKIAYIYFLGFIGCFETFFTQVKAPWNTLGWRSNFSCIFAFCTIAFFILLIMRCKKSPNPLFNISLFKNKEFTLLAFSSLIMGCAIWGGTTLYVFLLRDAFKYEYITTGLVFSVYGFSLYITGTIAYFLKNIKHIYYVLFGLLCIVISCFANHAFTIQSGPIDVILLSILRGIGTGLCLHHIGTVAQIRAPKEHADEAVTLILICRQFAAFAGTSMLSVVIVMREAYHTLRFGEQVEIYSGAFKRYIRQFQLYSESNIDTGFSNSWSESAKQAKDFVENNIRTQAHIAAFDDAFFIFGCICLTVLVLMTLNEISLYIKKRPYLNKNSNQIAKQ